MKLVRPTPDGAEGGVDGGPTPVAVEEPTTMPRTTIRCPECYTRVVVAPDEDETTSLWLHGLSGRCRAKQTPKTERPRRKERLEAMLGEEWG